MDAQTKDKFRAAMTLDDWLDAVSVHAPAMWENELGPVGWYAVSVDDEGGIVAYFRDSTDAYRFRLDYINRRLNP